MRVLGIWLILATLTNPCRADDGPVRADWVVRGGLVVDGTGKLRPGSKIVEGGAKPAETAK